MQFKRAIAGAIAAVGIGAVGLAGAGAANASTEGHGPAGQPGNSTTSSVSDSFNTTTDTKTVTVNRESFNTRTTTIHTTNILSGNFSGNTIVIKFSLFNGNVFSALNGVRIGTNNGGGSGVVNNTPLQPAS